MGSPRGRNPRPGMGALLGRWFLREALESDVLSAFGVSIRGLHEETERKDISAVTTH